MTRRVQAVAAGRSPPAWSSSGTGDTKRWAQKTSPRSLSPSLSLSLPRSYTQSLSLSRMLSLSLPLTTCQLASTKVKNFGTFFKGIEHWHANLTQYIYDTFCMIHMSTAVLFYLSTHNIPHVHHMLLSCDSWDMYVITLRQERLLFHVLVIGVMHAWNLIGDFKECLIITQGRPFNNMSTWWTNNIHLC